jgi:hypothetical protein
MFEDDDKNRIHVRAQVRVIMDMLIHPLRVEETTAAGCGPVTPLQSLH